MKNDTLQSRLARAAKKFSLSAFVLISFIGYALHNRSDYSAGSLTQAVPAQDPPAPTEVPSRPERNFEDREEFPAPSVLQNQRQQAQPDQNAQPAPQAQAVPAQPQNPPASSGRYKDGTFTGPEIDVNYGLVQVQAVIQNGRITNVQFTEYPTDRRTSRRINTFAAPILQQEAVQAQSANVDIITGATLTSEGFQMSLQEALRQAGGLQ